MTAEFTDDALLGGRVIVRQPVNGYRAAIDPVLLAAAAAPAQGDRVLDVGCGTGAAMFCLARRCPDVSLTGLERDPAAVVYGRAGIALNKFQDRVDLIAGDLAAPPAAFGNGFALVLSNPPYSASGSVAPDPGKAAAHHESSLDLAGWVAACLAFVKPKGRLVIIHRGDRLSELLMALRDGAGDLRILPIRSRATDPARRVIVSAGKGRRTGDTLLPALVMHAADGTFSEAAQAVLRDGAALDMTA